VSTNNDTAISAAIMTENDSLSRGILLSPDERYDIWEIKRIERPHLMEFENEQEDVVGRSDDDDEPPVGNNALPLVDGCDLKGWRHSKLMPISIFIQGVLNVGSGCSLMRRESQIPVVPSASTSRWKTLQAKLLEPPKVTVQRIPEKVALGLSHYPWFEKENVPVILEGLTKTWKAMETCTFDRLVKDFGDFDWRFSDTHGAMMSLRTYKKYAGSMEGQLDDAPLAVYDSQLHTDERACLLEDYSVPKCFDAPDLFQDMLSSHEVEEKEDDTTECMPPYRWILIGSPRSGTGLHIDPLGTHAWVTLIEGAKRWVLFPYGTDPSAIGMQEPQIPSGIWFSSGWYQTAMELVPGAIEILQSPGETVYVPAGWPHLVLNLEFSTAITQNYATEYPSFSRILQATEEEEPEMSVEWKEYLKHERPDIWEQHARDTKLVAASASSSFQHLENEARIDVVA
jgi:histone arginine demethylase JMJD6